jgi:hypothetical protein
MTYYDAFLCALLRVRERMKSDPDFAARQRASKRKSRRKVMDKTGPGGVPEVMG